MGLVIVGHRCEYRGHRWRLPNSAKSTLRRSSTLCHSGLTDLISRGCNHPISWKGSNAKRHTGIRISCRWDLHRILIGKSLNRTLHSIRCLPDSSEGAHGFWYQATCPWDREEVPRRQIQRSNPATRRYGVYQRDVSRSDVYLLGRSLLFPKRDFLIAVDSHVGRPRRQHRRIDRLDSVAELRRSATLA